MEELQETIGALAATVERNVDAAIQSVVNVDEAAAAEVIRSDREIDEAEVRAEEEALKIVALHQPVADDLRFIITMLKVNHELERIGDLAAEIAESVHRLREGAVGAYADDLRALTRETRSMVSRCVQALRQRDEVLAREVWRNDDTVDALMVRLGQRLQDDAAAGADAQSLFALFGMVRALERMADHATNVAKDVIYLVEGRIVRHRAGEFTQRAAGGLLRVLFVCVHNSARSQMAAAWLNHLHGDRFDADSAGLHPGELNPLAVAVMKEAGIDISANRTQDVSDAVQTGRPLDYLITVCAEAEAGKCPVVPSEAETLHWTFDDPSAFTGSREEKLRETRRVRDEIRARVEQWVADLTAGHAPA
jgi:phosphate transport system regulatory protein PhoU/thioredoxin type arsenate reductase